MIVVGYARVSTRDQSFQIQVDRLKAAGAVEVFQEKASGLDGERPELSACLRYLRAGDTLLVTKLDRLARSTLDLHRIAAELDSRGVAFKALDDCFVDTTSRTGKLVMGILASIAEFETALRRERQMEGIERAKAEGRTGGRPSVITDEVATHILKLSTEAQSVRSIAKMVGLSKSTVQNVLQRRGRLPSVLGDAAAEL